MSGGPPAPEEKLLLWLWPKGEIVLFIIWLLESKAFRRNTSCLFTFVVLCIVSTIASLVLVEESPCRPRSLRSCPTVLESVQELLQRPGIDVGLESAQHEIKHGAIVFFTELLSVLQSNITQCVQNLGVTGAGLL